MSNNEQIDAPVVSPDDSEKKVQTLEEDDEFEDFPSESWPESETLGAKNQDKLWEEDWDDDDLEDDFAQKLKEELAKVQPKK